MSIKTPRRSVENSKSRHGGARPGAGRKRGSKWPRTIAKEQQRERFRALVAEHFDPIVQAHIENALGIKYLVVRDKATGKFLRVGELRAKVLKPNEEAIEVWEKDPSAQAFSTILAYTLDKPAEQEIRVNVTGEAELVARLEQGRRRVAEARAQRGGQ